MAMIKCVSCKEKFEPDEYVEAGDTIMCPACYEEMEVVSVDPVKIRKIEKDVTDDDEEYNDTGSESYGSNNDYDPQGYDD